MSLLLPAMSPLRSRPASFALALALLVATAAAAQAQPTPGPTTTATTATTVPPTTDPPAPPTTKFLGIFPPATTTTTAPPPSTAPTTAPAAGPTTTVAPVAGDGVPPPGTPRAVPPDAQRRIDAVIRTGANNTTAWLAALQPLVTEFGMTPTDAAITGAGHFPVAGPTTWSDDWLYPRYVPTFHLHQGVDLFAASGTPVRAPFDGTLKYTDGAVGGMAAYVSLPDKTFVYMAHLSAFAPGKVNGQQVRQGEVVGFVGDSGDARGGAPHVHFELHPKGGAAVPPKPSIDAWLAEATAAAPKVIEATRAARKAATGSSAGASVTAVAEVTANPSGVSAAVDPAAALWAASSNPAIGTIDLASSLVASAAADLAWPKPQA